VVSLYVESLLISFSKSIVAKMDIDNQNDRWVKFSAERAQRKANFAKNLYKYAGAASIFLILFELHKTAMSYEIIVESSALITFQIARIFLKISVLPLNYVFELEPILRRRKGDDDIIDASDKFLGSRSIMKNFIIEGTIEWRGFVYVLVGAICTISNIYLAVILSDRKMAETDPGSIALIISGASFLSLRSKYPSEFEKLYE